MKIPAAFAAVLFAASQLFAQTQPIAPAAPAKVSESKPAVSKVTPVVKTPAKKDEKKVVPEPKIPGTSITRDNGTFLGLEVVDGNFKLSFYDKKKKLMVPDVARASARWPNVRGPGDYRTILNSSGNALVGAKAVIPPYTWNVFLTLLQGEGDETKAVESYVVPFRG